MPTSSSSQPQATWKTALAVLSLVLAAAIWVSGLVASLTRPSVAPTLSLQQQELTLLAEPALPPQLRPLLAGPEPRDLLRQAIQASPPEQRSERQQRMLTLLSKASDGIHSQGSGAEADPLIRLLSCEALRGRTDRCVDPAVSQVAAVRLGLSVLVPLMSIVLGCGLLLRQGWLLLRRRQEPWPSLKGPALTLIDMALLVAGGFVVISAVGVPVVAAPLVRSLTAGLVSPRREAMEVVIQYSVMALPSLLILRRQLKALPMERCPPGGWLQWKLRPPASAMTGAVAAWLMVTPVVTFTGWLLVRLLGDPGGSNPLLELVLSSRDPIALGLMAFTAVVLAPLFEEVIFRGALLPVLTESVGVFWGVVLSGLTFGLAHISIGELAPLTVLGIGLALMRLSSGRLLPCVLMHALWNAVTFFNLLLL